MADTDNSLKALREVIARLTAPDGCPWDREQTPKTMADYVIEESHELVAAIRSDDLDEIRGELGDVFFLLLFIADYYEKKGDFSLADALDYSRQKMVRRHPHVFGNAEFDNIDEQLRAWENIKREERAEKGASRGVFASLPESLPPLIKAYRIHSKAARIGFTWPNEDEAERQFESEWLEWLDASQSGDNAAQVHELGDMLFSLVELGRRKGIKANEALDMATRRFLRRFIRMEEFAAERGRDLSQMNLDEQDELWSLAKSEEGDAGDGGDGGSEN